MSPDAWSRSGQRDALPFAASRWLAQLHIRGPGQVGSLPMVPSNRLHLRYEIIGVPSPLGSLGPPQANSWKSNYGQLRRNIDHFVRPASTRSRSPSLSPWNSTSGPPIQESQPTYRCALQACPTGRSHGSHCYPSDPNLSRRTSLSSWCSRHLDGGTKQQKSAGRPAGRP